VGAEPELVRRVGGAFLLSRSLSSRYVRLLFLSTHQFDASKRRLQSVSVPDWEAFSASLLLHWTSAASGLELGRSRIQSRVGLLR